MATLSLVFAFLFAPAGAILGHLGLAQIRRTGELGRDRALVGVTLSYIFILLAVVALAGWATLAGSTSPHRTPPGSGTAAGPPPPTVPPETIATLLPGLDALRNITGDANLDVGPTWNSPGRSAEDGSIDRPECWGSIAAGSPDAYTPGALAGYHAGQFTDTRSMLKSMQVIQGVAAFRDPAAAQAQLSALLCGMAPVRRLYRHRDRSRWAADRDVVERARRRRQRDHHPGSDAQGHPGALGTGDRGQGERRHRPERVRQRHHGQRAAPRGRGQHRQLHPRQDPRLIATDSCVATRCARLRRACDRH